MSAYRKDFDKIKCMFFLIKDEIWKKVSNILKKEFYSKAVYNEKYIKTKIKYYNGKIDTNFLSVILIDSVYKKDKNYYPQVFLDE